MRCTCTSERPDHAKRRNTLWKSLAGSHQHSVISSNARARTHLRTHTHATLAFLTPPIVSAYHDSRVYSFWKPQRSVNPRVGFFFSVLWTEKKKKNEEEEITNNSLRIAGEERRDPCNPVLHKGSDPAIKVLIKGTDTLYWCSKSSLRQRCKRWMVYYRLLCVRLIPCTRLAIGFSLFHTFNSKV